MRKRAGTEIVPIKLRIREDLRARLARAAENLGHSLNSEMTRRLEESFQREPMVALVEQVQAHVLEAKEIYLKALETSFQAERMLKKGGKK
jgi:uncharacterized protein (DUF1778 family)